MAQWSRHHLAPLFRPPASHEQLFADKQGSKTVQKQSVLELYANMCLPGMIGIAIVMQHGGTGLNLPYCHFRVAMGFVWQLILVAVVSVGVGLYATYIVPRGGPEISPNISTPFSLITFALSLLLVFKTNSSYSRWWEGRVIWGQIVNYGRNLPRQLLSYCPPPEYCTPAQRDIIRTALRWTAATVHVCKGHLTEETSARSEDEASHLLTPEERHYLNSCWANRPLGMTYVLSWLCCHHALGLKDQQQVSIQDQITLFMNCSGGCERIQKTPIPAAYARHTSRMLMIYVTLSPIMLWPTTGWATPVVAPLIAFLLLGTENIGVMIEEPFHVLPLLAICRGIEAGIRDLAAACQLSLEPLPPPPISPPGPLPPLSKDGFSQKSPMGVLLSILRLDQHPELLPGGKVFDTQLPVMARYGVPAGQGLPVGQESTTKSSTEVCVDGIGMTAWQRNVVSYQQPGAHTACGHARSEAPGHHGQQGAGVQMQDGHAPMPHVQHDTEAQVETAFSRQQAAGHAWVGEGASINGQHEGLLHGENGEWLHGQHGGVFMHELQPIMRSNELDTTAHREELALMHTSEGLPLCATTTMAEAENTTGGVEGLPFIAQRRG